ncbi:GMC family oxidoreductase [Rubellimicrobium rubrum]|uniref:GMC family oxidoreductase n=1 Tax=Rubellimicrobium rubrum TaxID=2585369 RepID=UPI00319E2438
MAEHGMSVLFLEKGRSGWRTEENRLDANVTDPFARSLRGAWPEPIQVTQDGVQKTFFAALGSGVGGSSVFYAAVLERPEPRDFDHHWPISYNEMKPWYDQSEAMFFVRGETDPLSVVPTPALLPPLPFNSVDELVLARLRTNGMHPYRLHAALKYLPDCAVCLGRKCPRPCKMDARSAGVEPALATGNATLLENCEVRRVLGTQGQVTGVEAIIGGETLVLRSSRVVIAAGALSTPRLLLNSASDIWPDGCGNTGGHVGRNLMLHLNEVFAVWPGRSWSGSPSAPAKAVGLRDLMIVDGQRLGMVQALGVDARQSEILMAIRERLGAGRLGRSSIIREGARVPAKITSAVLGTAKLFVGLLEDFPDPSNRVIVDPARPSSIVAEYHVPHELQIRRQLFRGAIKRAFKGMRPVFLNRDAQPNWGHPCGTARMGLTPASSVVDRNCRVHGIGNLWIADASVFSSSFGVNPSLTIAANALRVASVITRERTS